MATRGNAHFLPQLRNTLRFPLPCELRPDSPAVTPEHPGAYPRNSNGDLLPRGNTRGCLSYPWYLEKNPKPPTATRDKPRDSPVNARRGPFLLNASSAIPRSLSKLERRFDSLHSTQGDPKIPITTRDLSRVTRHNWRRAPCFPPHLEIRAHSLLQLKKNPNFPSCRGPAPADPGYSKEGRHQRGSVNN